MRWELGGRETLLVLLALVDIPAALCDNSDHGAKFMSSTLLAAPEVCESRTINYITHTLPQQCLRTSWTSQPASATTATDGPPSATATRDSEASAETKADPERVEHKTEEGATKEKASDQQTAPGAEDGAEDLATSSFMSFEEWKEMMLRKSGQDPAEIKGHKQPHREHKGHRDAGDSHADLDSLQDDGEISLDFDALSDKVSELTGGSTPEPSVEVHEEQVLHDDGKVQYYRSKDAGKTCKERFSYSSFDAGATVLKTSPGAKNPKSILVENKDSYMLLECHTKNKFVIVELSDDILVDTVVLANFEFFSSMIRRFRVSVSDRYPVKLDKWVELGTFEARNSRDIQPFLIEHPQIYTKYIRVEFLTHYGNEYYCPVSLLRVHGTRMLDSWKEPDSSRDDDEAETIDGTPEEQLQDGSAHETETIMETPQPSNLAEQAPVQSQENSSVTSVFREVSLSPWQRQPIFEYELTTDICKAESPSTESPTPVTSSSVPVDPDSNLPKAAREVSSDSLISLPSQPTQSSVSSSTDVVSSKASSVMVSSPTVPSPSPKPSTDSAASASSPTSSPSTKQQQQPQSAAKADATEPPASPPPVKASTPTTQTVPKNKTSTSSSQSSSPTVQESFFKTVTKRLQHLESNTSLSLQYIEEQSRFLQEALLKMEKRQISRVDAFLDTLNNTVFAELRNVRAQYDQIWQSTVIALESQREQSQRETVALSDRLSLLADEVVFQKRMAILQSVLLLAALVLVIFSRGYYVNGSAPGPNDFYPSPFGSFRQHHRDGSMSAPALVQTPARSPSDHDLDLDSGEYSAGSPSPVRQGSLRSVRQPLSRSPSYNDKVLPLTPNSKSAMSEYDDSREPTPIINIEDVDVPFFHDHGGSNTAEGAYVTPPPAVRFKRLQREDSLASDDAETTDSVEGARAAKSSNDGNATTGNDEFIPGSDFLDAVQHEELLSLQVKGLPRRSALSQLGSARKPLPALPEDVPEDPEPG